MYTKIGNVLNSFTLHINSNNGCSNFIRNILVMSVAGRKFEFWRERDRELLKTYRMIIGESPIIYIPDVMRKVVASPCSRFWVSEPRAYYACCMLRKYGRLDKRMNPLKRQMCIEIYARVQLKMSEGVKFSDAISIVISSPAPKFYLAPESAYVMISKIKKCLREKV